MIQNKHIYDRNKDKSLAINSLKRDGTSQQQRLSMSLLPSYAKVDERNIKDFLVFWYEYARLLNYQDITDLSGANIKDWQFLFNDIAHLIKKDDDKAWQNYWQRIKEQENQAPHLALMMAFLKIFKHAQTHLNNLTERHLNFFYKNVLHFKKQKAIPNTVHVIFELNKNKNSYKLPKNTYLKAGRRKDASEILYATDKECILNKTQIADLKSIYTHQKEEQIYGVYAIPMPKSKDGLGEKFDDAAIPTWHLFKQGLSENIAESPIIFDATIGFAIASPILLLSEGKRQIRLKVSLDSGGKTIENEIERNRIIDKLVRQLVGILHVFDVNAISGKTIRECIKELSEKELKQQNPLPLWEILEEQAPQNLVYELLERTNTQNVKDLKRKDKKALLKQLVEILIDEANEIFATHLQNLSLDNSFFTAYLTTEYEWLQKEVAFELLPKENAFVFKIDLPITDEAISYYQESFHKKSIHTSSPVLQILFANEIPPAFYQLLYKYPMQSLQIDVSCSELSNLIVQNDLGILEADRPFDLFGPQPHKGSAFYIGHSEALHKKVHHIDINFEWYNLPDNFDYHYIDYSKETSRKFSVDVQFLYRKQWVPILNHAEYPVKYDLFKNENDEYIELKDIQICFNETNLCLQAHETTEDIIYLDNSTQHGFLKISLIEPSVAFGHKEYPHLYAQTLSRNLIQETLIIVNDNEIAREQTKDKKGEKPNNVTAKKVFKPAQLPNEPYTPAIHNLRLSYQATETIHFKTKQKHQNKTEEFFHIHPFGNAPIQHHNNTFLLPSYQEEGILYIALDEIYAPQSLSLFFQMEEGSAESVNNKSKVKWHFLSNNEWIAFEITQIPSDTTRGLQQSGIINFHIPKQINRNNTILPNTHYWLRLSVSKHISGINKILDIHTQAVSATYVLMPNENVLDAPSLSPRSIHELADPRSAIRDIHQPYYSFNGKNYEQDNDFYGRVSEHLKHKSRCITIWDYERVVLNKFHTVYKVKCLNNYRILNDNDDWEIAASHVTLVTIPKLPKLQSINRLQPRTSSNTLSEISDYIKKHTTPFLQLKVVNPIYEEVQVKIHVGFEKTYDEGYYIHVLNEDIKRFLSPWAYEHGRDIVFGGSIHKSAIINFVEELEYIKYVYQIQIFQNEELIESAEATQPRSILVSANNHIINPTQPESLDTELEGIGYMIIEVNFEVFEEI
ncbi:MAG: hypothetical protein ACPG5B_04750 [Chitinophagales bacterium]